MTYEALLLDIGDVIVDVAGSALDRYEQVTGQKVRGRGPFSSSDPLWQRRLAGDLTLTGYWDEVAREAGLVDWRTLFRTVSDVVPDEVFNRDALALIADARAAGHRVGVLSNDAYSVNGPEFFQRPEFEELDAFVDSTQVGVRKPAPEPYLAAAAALGVATEAVVYLDDTPACVEGARAVGMTGLYVDPADRGPAFDRARRLLGLAPETRASRVVRAFEDRYRRQDFAGLVGLLHPDVVIHWNGQKAADGLDQARQFLTERLGVGTAGGADHEVVMTLRVAEGDTVGVEWTSSSGTEGGPPVQGCGGAFWTMRGDHIIEVRAFHHVEGR